MGGTDTGATVLDGLVGDAELAKVVADHLGLERERRICRSSKYSNSIAQRGENMTDAQTSMMQSLAIQGFNYFESYVLYKNDEIFHDVPPTLISTWLKVFPL